MISSRIFRRLGAVAAVAVSGVFLVLAFREVNWQGVTEALRQTQLGWVIVGAVIGLFGFLIRSVEWHYLLRPIVRISGARLFSPVAIGYMANNLLPARAGEFARAYIVGKRESVGKTVALGSIMLERIFDGLVLLLILVVVSFAFPYASWVKQGGVILAIVFLGLSVTLILVMVQLDRCLHVIDATVGRFWPWGANAVKFYLKSFLLGLDLKHHPACVVKAFGLTILRWLIEALMYLFVLHSMGLLGDVPIHGVLFVMVTVNIACMVPQAPGFIGSVQFASIESLTLFGVDRETAAAFSLLIHASFFLPITLAGLIALALDHISLLELYRRGTGAILKSRGNEASTS